MLTDRDDARRLLQELGAPPRLLRHLELVGEAGDALVHGLDELGIRVDAQRVELGIAVHDAGKIVHPAELDGPGAAHEAAGETLLLARGVAPAIARCCVTHAAWDGPDVSFEELLVALADHLWKGKRRPELEMLVVDRASLGLGVTRWDVFEPLDTLFEKIAAGADDRLERSRA